MSGIDGVLLSIEVQLAAGCGHVWLSAEHAHDVLDYVADRSGLVRSTFRCASSSSPTTAPSRSTRPARSPAATGACRGSRSGR